MMKRVGCDAQEIRHAAEIVATVLGAECAGLVRLASEWLCWTSRSRLSVLLLDLLLL